MSSKKLVFIPNTVDYDKVKSLGLDEQKYLLLQVKYKQLFEKNIISKLDFSDLERQLKKKGIPIVHDKIYNFYRKYSILGSNYVYFRNNIHIENLTINEINDLTSGNVDINFLANTFQRVLFEKGDYTFLGLPSDESKVLSQSIMLELAVDYSKLKDLDSVVLIKNIINEFKKRALQQYGPLISKLLETPNQTVSIHFYDAMPDSFINTSFENDDVVVEENFPPGDDYKSNIDYELGKKLFDEYTEREEMPNGDVYEIVYYDKFWNVVPKEKSITSARFKVSEKIK